MVYRLFKWSTAKAKATWRWYRYQRGFFKKLFVLPFVLWLIAFWLALSALAAFIIGPVGWAIIAATSMLTRLRDALRIRWQRSGALGWVWFGALLLTVQSMLIVVLVLDWVVTAHDVVRVLERA